MRDVAESFSGIISAGLKELRFQGGRAGKTNIILSFILGVLYIAIVLTDELKEVLQFLHGESSNSNVKYLLFLVIVVFFFLSVWFVHATDAYVRKMRKSRTAASRQDQGEAPPV
jgi:hypothetical protein